MRRTLPTRAPLLPAPLHQQVQRTRGAVNSTGRVSAYPGNQATLRRLSRTAPHIQYKLTVGAVNDPLEAEADRVVDQVMRMPASSSTEPAVVQRKCAACEEEKINRKCAGEEEEKNVQKKSDGQAASAAEAPPVVHDVLGSSGQPLDAATRTFFEPRFGADFSGVRVHTDPVAASSAGAIKASAYTAGSHIAFASGRYTPGTDAGTRLLAHELAHVVQQQGRQPLADPGATPIRRACLPASSCGSTTSGSAGDFDTSVENAEDPARARRAAMSPARQRVHGHVGHARALETFLEGQTPGLLANIHGIFIDQDMDPRAGAATWVCADMTPPIRGATKPCVFVPGHLNQEAFQFNTDTAATTIGGRTREDWRVDALQALTHEIQHVFYNNTKGGTASPAGVTCARADIEAELSELNAILSEFPIAFNSIPAGAPAGDPARVRLADWFDFKITNDKESIQGALKKMDCKCSCGDTDVYVKETFHFVADSWTDAQRNALNSELKKPVWSLRWPL